MSSLTRVEPFEFQKHRVEVCNRASAVEDIDGFLEFGWTVVKVVELSGDQLLFVLEVPNAKALAHIQEGIVAFEALTKRLGLE